MAQFTKSRKAPGEATGYIRIQSLDKRGLESDTVPEARSTLDLEDGREPMENR